MSDDFDFDALRKEFLTWDAATQERVAAMLDGSRRKYVWYCTRGRGCDGKPHDGAPEPHARADQWPPTGADWTTWFALGGRGSGKTRSGAEWTRKKTERAPRGALIGPTVAHVREVLVEGESGIIKVFERAGQNVLWEPSKRRVTVPNGAVLSTYSGEEPDRLRGPEHYFSWLDEPAHMALINEVWDNLMLGLRLGKHPQVYCTTTPLPTKWVKGIIADPDTRSVKVSTYVNLDNLAPTFRKQVLDKYEGTRLGRQELHGEILEDVEGALWAWDDIDDHRMDALAWEMDRIVIGVDPAGTASTRRDEQGIVAVGRLGNDVYVLGDVSGHYTPDAWANKAWALYDALQADAIVAEKNYGGDMVRATLTNARINQRGRLDGKVDLVHSRRGKALRAEPIVALYQQGRVHHVQIFADLEEQMTTWVPGVGESPDRVDALVHAITEVSGADGQTDVAVPQGRMPTHDPRVVDRAFAAAGATRGGDLGMAVFAAELLGDTHADEVRTGNGLRVWG